MTRRGAFLAAAFWSLGAGVASADLYGVLGGGAALVGPGMAAWTAAGRGAARVAWDLLRDPSSGTEDMVDEDFPVAASDAASAAASDPAAGIPAAGAWVEVRPGDSLSAIASRRCGDPGSWRAIFEANRDRVRDPNMIYPGTRLRVPCGGASARGGRSEGDPAGGSKAGGSDRTAPRSTADAGGLRPPLKPGAYEVTSEFGPRSSFKTSTGRASSNHKGIDLWAPAGTPVGAAAAGVVVEARWYGGYGWTVILRHGDGRETLYAHLQRRPSLKPGARVAAGQPVGRLGMTGSATGPHLHFEVLEGGVAKNPRHYCRF